MRISALILGTLLAVGCSSAANKKLDEFADRACACKDVECAQKVSQEFLAWVKDNENARGDEGKAQASIKRMQECITKIPSTMMKDMKAPDMKMDDKAGDKAEEKPAN